MKHILYKLLAGILLPALLGLAGLSAVTLIQTSRGMGQLNDVMIEESSQKAAAELQAYLQRYMSVAEMAAAYPDVIALCNELGPDQPIQESPNFYSVLQYYAQLASKNQYIVEYCACDLDANQMMVSDGSTYQDVSLTSYSWYQLLQQEQQTCVTEPYEDRISGITVSSIATYIYDQTGHTVGAVAVHLDVANLIETMSQYTMAETGEFAFLAGDGTVVYHPNENYMGKHYKDLPIGQTCKDAIAAGNDTAVVFEDSNLGLVHGYVTQVPGISWSVLSMLPDAEYTAGFDGMFHSYLIIGSAIFILLILIVVFGGRAIVKPLKKLRASANEVADGNLNVHIDVKSKDEVGQLASAFSLTAERLNEYVKYIDEISYALEEIAKGNLKFTLKYNYEGDFAKIKQALLDTQKNMTRTISQLSQSSNMMTTGSHQVSDSAQSLSQSSTEQAAAVEELSSSVADISKHIQANASDAKDGANYADRTNQLIGEANEKMKNAEAAMDLIHDKSIEIAKIIKDIDDIAFQTNILALNAAVEAARAGDAGHGFAVVADEIRSLAQKSAESAKNTAKLIEETTVAVNNGTALAKDTSDTMNEVVSASGEIHTLTKQIAETSNQQAVSVRQVSDGIEQISGAVQMNAASAEESAAISEELASHALTLQELVSGFSFEGDESSHGTPSPSSEPNPSAVTQSDIPPETNEKKPLKIKLPPQSSRRTGGKYQ